MTFGGTAVLFLYFLVLVILGVFGVHRYAMVYLYNRYKDRKAVFRPISEGRQPPMVTIQLPLFNEMYVVDRLIASVMEIRYPKDRLEVQVLDDSTDETTAIAEAAVEKARAQGLNITLIHRQDRVGFKAGALEMPTSSLQRTSSRSRWGISRTRGSGWSRPAGVTSIGATLS